MNPNPTPSLGLACLVFRLLVVGATCFAAACSSSPKTLDAGYLTRSDFVEGDWAVPRGDFENCQRRLVLLVNVDESGSRQTDLCKYVEAELGRIKRFKTYVAWNNGAFVLAEDLADIGEGNYTSREPASFDLGLSLSILGQKRETLTKAGNKLYSFSSDVACTLSDIRTGEQLFARVFRGEQNNRTSILGLNGAWRGGFDPNSKSDVETAYAESALTALREIVSQLGNEYPVVSKVMNGTSTRLSIDKGTDIGLLGAENFIEIGRAHV